ncbi:hypothetical protein [uncultured Psychroserpens sp.]|uniref:hypothetical protein n=1 Tax=uncultured Psychroserpens sp. TaxID=255436 RepID=UPI0026322276|nr:hypothetical protein [uncultured Psychroserpens sp.]
MKTNKILKIILAVIIGEVLMILLITLAQEIIVDGVKLNSSPISNIIIGGLGTLMSGLTVGAVATCVAGKSNYIPIIILSIFVVIETTYLIIADKINNPIWFDAMAAISLIGTIWLGYYFNKFLFKED